MLELLAGLTNTEWTLLVLVKYLKNWQINCHEKILIQIGYCNGLYICHWVLSFSLKRILTCLFVLQAWKLCPQGNPTSKLIQYLARQTSNIPRCYDLLGMFLHLFTYSVSLPEVENTLHNSYWQDKVELLDQFLRFDLN